MRKSQRLITVTLFIAILCCTAFARPITVSGVVADSASGLFIPGALVIIEGNNTDSATTDTSGSFTKADVDVPGGDYTLLVTVQMAGYLTRTDSVTDNTNELDLGTLKITPISYINVLGKVIDLYTDDPISQVRVEVSALNTDSAYTDTLGKFQIDSVQLSYFDPMLSYLITKTNYDTIDASTFVQDDPLDLGIIKLKDLTVAIHNNARLILNRKPNKILVHSLKGQLLYSGKDLQYSKLKDLVNAQPVIVSYKHNNTLLYTKKYFNLE
jgi:hypothetical protein